MRRITHFAGLPLSRWMFALRIWLAIHLALGTAFWIQLNGAESAGVIAAMLAVQTRGQAFEKAAYCFLGTLVGGIVSVVIVGLFAQARELYGLTYSAWLAVCVFAAGFLDGNRAYGAVICGYTVSIVAVMHIDDPGSVFSEIVNRCAAIAIGIAATVLVTDLLAGPEIGPGLLARVRTGAAKARAFADGVLRDGPTAGMDARMAALLAAASNQHLFLNALPVEAVSGTARAGAVRAALAGLVGEVRAARALAIAERGPHPTGDPGLRALVERRLSGELLAGREAAERALRAARSGRPVAHAPRMPVYRPWESALRNALRAFAASVLTGSLLALTGWPLTAFAWAMVGVVICLSSNAPDPAAMTRGALIGLPTAIVLGGVTKFLILGGVDQFPLLMLGTAPTLFATLLVTSSPRPALVGAGLLTTVYTIVVVAPGNPQSYDPQSYVQLSILLVVVAVLAFVLARVLFPTTDAHRRRWALAAMRRDLRAALRGEGRQRPEGEARLLDASRIGTLAGLRAAGADHDADLAAALRMSDLARAARRVARDLDAFPARSADPRAPDRVRAVLAAADADGLRRAALDLVHGGDASQAIAADLAWAADLIDGPGASAEAGPRAAEAA